MEVSTHGTRRRQASLRALGHLLWIALAFSPLAEARGQRDNDPTSCPYCGGDAAVMSRAGIVSHGGFEFGTADSAGVDELLASCDIRWIESEHFEIGIATGPYKVAQDERKGIRAELTELRELLPEINPRARILDPWLRAHLYAMRVEKVWDHFLEVMQVEAGDFPSGEQQWMIGEPYMGEGPYLGQKGKYELLITPSEATHVAFLRAHFGLGVKKTQRWNVTARDTMIAVMHLQDGNLNKDSALHGHVAFNLSINMLDGYKHYSYETPIWIREGLGHHFERRIDPRHNSFDASEGGIAKGTSKSDWIPPIKKLIRSDKFPRLAELMRIETYVELDLADHYASWSLTRFLLDEHAQAYACLNAALHGIKDAEGRPDGSRMKDKHREAVKQCLGMSYAQLDEAWREWALRQE